MAMNLTPNLHPTVLHPIELAPFIQYILTHHNNPTTLLICSTQESFLRQLSASITHEKAQERQAAEAEGLDLRRSERIASRRLELLVPTIQQLQDSRSVKVVFCATVAQMLAFLGIYGISDTTMQDVNEGMDGSARRLPTLALLNPLQLHRDAPSFSAQGLSRTFASTVEAAVRSKQKLIIAECPSRVAVDGTRNPAPSQQGADGDDDEEVEPTDDRETEHDPWEQQVSILNVTTRSFGVGERGWVGRTVQIKRIAARWCVFERSEI